MYASTSLKLVVDEITTPYLVLVSTGTYEIGSPRVASELQEIDMSV